jgi:hypothetical protein
MLVELAIAVTLFAEPEPVEKSPPQQFSAMQKLVATAKLVRATTDCIIDAVKKDPRSLASSSNTGDMIVAAFAGPCRIPAQTMVDAYDRYFGYGRGEKFLMGPYLDILPQALEDARKNPTGPPP